MKNVAKKIFAGIAGTALALSPASAIANDDAPATNGAAAITANALTVQFVGAQNRTINDARTLAADASHNKVAIVVWGGNRAIQQEAYNAALDLVDMGIPTAFVLAPDENGLEGDAAMTVYAASLPRSDSRWGTNYTDQVRADMREAGIAAYREAFPQQVAALSLR